MPITIRGAHAHNLKNISLELGPGLTVITGISGSGKTSLIFDTLYHEARRRFLDIYSLGSTTARLAPADVESITGLGPAVAVGQNRLNRNPNSTLATASGLHPFLRLLFANFGERTCPACGTKLFVYSEDNLVQHMAQLNFTDPVQIRSPLLTHVEGSHQTLLNYLLEHFPTNSLFVDGTPWAGQPLAPDRPHDLELLLSEYNQPPPIHQLRENVHVSIALGSRAIRIVTKNFSQVLTCAPVCTGCGKWFGALSPILFNSKCPHCAGNGCKVCQGSGMDPLAATVHLDGLRFHEFLALPVKKVSVVMNKIVLPEPAKRLQVEIERRLAAMEKVGLGYISLDRPSPSLSRGEAQRVSLALTFISRLEDMLHILDEPTIGQHPADVQRLLPALSELPGPIVFVEHDRLAAADADQVIDLGPGAGEQGGHVVFQGLPAELWKTSSLTGEYFSLRKRLETRAPAKKPTKFMIIKDADLHNLDHINVPIPIQCLSVITGVSGSGKSTLVEDVLFASLKGEKPVGCQGIAGPRLKPVIVDQEPIGRNPRSNPATYSKLADIIRDLFSLAGDLSSSHFSFNRSEGACPTCNGLGAIEISMRYLPPTWVTCADCGGDRFSAEVLAVNIPYKGKSLTISDFLELTASQALDFFTCDTSLPTTKRLTALHILQTLVDIGLGYLTLGQPSPTLSGGEAQRVKLARYLGGKSLRKELLILDEPSTGLHPHDLSGLMDILDRLVKAGATIVIVEHNTDIIRSADWIVDLGPGAGPEGGKLLYAGPPDGLLSVPGSQTGQALLMEADIHPPAIPSDRAYTSSTHIEVCQASMHNLKQVNVAFPKGKLTVVSGLSGSGKSSLVRDVLEAEAKRRFLETLSLYERQGTHEGPEAEVDSISGLGVALTATSERLVYSRRATVGTATEISQQLSGLFSILGKRTCLACGAPMQRLFEGWRCPVCDEHVPFARPQHFSPSTYSAACKNCNGVGSLQVPQPGKLIVHPDKPLLDGAMYSPGFFPNGFLGKPFNSGYYLLQALSSRYDFDPATTPWNKMTPAAQHAFLFGSNQKMDITMHSRSGRITHYQSHFPGFYGFIRDWDVGGTYTDTHTCPECQGAGLRKEYLAITLQGYNIHQINQLSLTKLGAILKEISLTQTELLPFQNSLNKIIQRLDFLSQVGLGYLHLSRVAGTLSAGEVQRVRLASLLGSGLTSLTLLVDEPTRGLHPREVDALIQALIRLRQEGNTVIVIEHDLQVIRAADFLVEMGPGAGIQGGQVMSQGAPEHVTRCETITASWLRGEAKPWLQQTPREPHGWMKIVGARTNNLQGETVMLPLGVLVGVCGVSGSGKSSLMIDTLGRALAPKKQTTSVAYAPVEPGEHDDIEGAPRRATLVDQSKAGMSSPIAFLNLTGALRSIFAASPEAKALGLTEEKLARRCSVCGGKGVTNLDMAFLPDVRVPCEACRGTGCIPEAWEARLKGTSFPEVFGLSIDQVFTLFGEDKRLKRPLITARQVGLGYLVLRQPGYALSGGEAQRLKIAVELMRKPGKDSLYILDEPTVGQHLEDVQRLVHVLHQLVDAGGSVLVVEHHPHFLVACDWLVELGPGGGPDGGHVIASGTPHDLASGNTPIAPYLRQVLEKNQ